MMGEQIQEHLSLRREKLRRRMEDMIGYLLLAGVIVSITLLVAGMGWSWLRTGSATLDYQLRGTTLFSLLVRDLRALAGKPQPSLLINLGIVALLLTPYLRVLVSFVYFAAVLRNWKYSLFTGFVLAVLTYSLFLQP